MGKLKKQLEDINILSFVIHGMVGLRLLSLPRDIVVHAENNGWISVLVGGVIAYFIGFGVYWLATQFPDLNLSQIIIVVLGKYIGRMILIGIGIYTITSVALALRSFGVSVKIFLLDKTPLYIIISTTLLILVYGVSKGIKTISIMFDVLLPFVLASIAVLILFATTTMEIKNLLPVFSQGVTPIMKGALQTTHPFLGVGILGYILPYCKDVKKTKKWIDVGIFIVIGIYLAIIIMCIMVFGVKEINQLIFPTISLSKTIRLKTELFERLESLFMTIWMPISFTTILGHYWASILNSKALFNTKRGHLIMWINVPIIFFIALYPENVVQLNYFLSLSNRLAQILTFGVLPIVVIATWVYKRREKHHANQ